MLQAYATEMMMRKLSLPFETIQCRKPKDYMEANKFLYVIKKLLIGDWKMWMGKKRIEKAKKMYPQFRENAEIRDKAFDDFANEMFHLSKFAPNREKLQELAYDYSAFLVGSDQLWRTDSVEHGYYTLEWVPDSIKKVAYSTSIGVKKIPWFQVEKNKRFMNRFDSMALREQSACDLVKSLTGRTVEVVLDPTLLFNGQEWLGIQDQEPIVKDKYIFCYLLGTNPMHRKEIKRISRECGCKIVALLHLDDYNPEDENFADIALYVGPREFLNLIRNAEMIFTDSFHCSVFSILYHKNFFTFSRFAENAKQSTNTRIDNLLNLVGLQSRKVNGTIPLEQMANETIDYKTVEDKLNVARKKSFDYLIKAFNLKEMI
jgi:hypothetical protein